MTGHHVAQSRYLVVNAPKVLADTLPVPRTGYNGIRQGTGTAPQEEDVGAQSPGNGNLSAGPSQMPSSGPPAP